ncbi:MAG: DUF6263 family protein [Planctomycetota bacterium]|nr:DUF6263 family protein [Planctomycetota bacterium]
MRFSILHTVCLSVVSTMLAMTAKPVIAQETFEYKGKVGDTHTYQTTAESKQKQSVAGQEFKTGFSQTAIAVRTYKEADANGNLQLESENKHLTVTGDLGPLGKYKFDSAAEKNESGSTLADQLNPLFERIATAKLTIKHSPLGEITAVEGYAELLADLLKGNPLAAQFAGGGSNEAAKAGMAELYLPFKKEGVKTGDEWETEFKIALPKLGNATGKKTVRFDGDEKLDGKAVKKFTVTMTIDFKLELNQGGAKVSGSIASDSSSGTFYFDPEIGQIVSAETTQTLSGTLTAQVGGANIEIETEQTQTMKIKRLDKLPDPNAAPASKTETKKAKQ